MDIADILKLAAIGVGSGFVPKLKDKPELQNAIVQSIRSAANIIDGRGSDDDANDELQKSWVKFAKKLEKEKQLTNEERISWLKPKVRADLILRDNKIPDDNTVTALAEGAVAVAKFS